MPFGVKSLTPPFSKQLYFKLNRLAWLSKLSTLVSKSLLKESIKFSVASLRSIGTIYKLSYFNRFILRTSEDIFVSSLYWWCNLFISCYILTSIIYIDSCWTTSRKNSNYLKLNNLFTKIKIQNLSWPKNWIDCLKVKMKKKTFSYKYLVSEN